MWQVILLIGCGLGARPRDFVEKMPWVNETLNYAMYSGYLDIPNSNGKSLHYILVESQNDPANDPLVLWLNGGPGCSSLDGFIYEHGPYVFPDEGTTLQKNQWSWNTNASVIYLEAPAGVGFSKMGDKSNNKTNDQITAHDNLVALLQFFRDFPEFKNHDFYITGESYAGIYVPTLAYNILLYNSYTLFDKINLQGIAVGNGVTDWNIDCDPAFIKWAWTHSLFNYYWYDRITEDCGRIDDKAGFSDLNSKPCQDDIATIYDTVVPGINIYNIYGPCIHNNEETAKKDHRIYFSWLFKKNPKLEVIPPCCAWKGAYEYFRNSTVREAFHIPADAPVWEFCVDLDYHDDFQHGSLYTYPHLIKSGLRVMVYSGDTDGSVPFIGSREWIQEKLNLGVKRDYASWWVDNQVAGYNIEYDGLTFVTVKGAGHMVPQWKRPQAHYMINQFLKGQSL